MKMLLVGWLVQRRLKKFQVVRGVSPHWNFVKTPFFNLTSIPLNPHPYQLHPQHSLKNYEKIFDNGLPPMDTFFISHGSPMLAIDELLPARAFLKSWQQTVLPPPEKKLNSILMISAHWETKHPSVNLVLGNSTIHDFYGFPSSLYQLEYPAPGAPILATRVKELLLKSNFKCVVEDKTRGLDHGAWIPLMLMYPEPDIPVCQLSVQTELDGTHHYNMGKALAPLRDEGVLIIGSGSATHNLGAPVQYENGPIFDWAFEFDKWLEESLVNGRHEDVNKYEKKAPHAKMAHPRPEHFYPLHVALGAAGENAKAELIHRSWEDGSLSYSSYRFTS